MFYVYVLLNEESVFYIGHTNDLKRRLKEHKINKVYSTKRLGGPWRLIYYEVSLDQADALRRERYLKSGPGRGYINKRLRYYLGKNLGRYRSGQTG